MPPNTRTPHITRTRRRARITGALLQRVGTRDLRLNSPNQCAVAIDRDSRPVGKGRMTHVEGIVVQFVERRPVGLVEPCLYLTAHSPGGQNTRLSREPDFKHTVRP